MYIFLFILLGISLNASAQLEEESFEQKDLLWVDFKNHSFLNVNTNKSITKDALITLSGQDQYEIVLAGSSYLDQIEKLKRSMKIMSLSISRNADNSYNIESSISDKKNNKIVRRVRRNYVPNDNLLTQTSLAIKLLFYPYEQVFPDREPKAKKDRLIVEKQVNQVQPPSVAAQNDFRKMINGLKLEVKNKIVQIQEEKKEALVTDKTESQTNQSNSNQNQNQENNASTTNLVLAPQNDNNPLPPAIFVPRNAFLFQAGIMSQNYLVQENFNSNDQFDIRTNVQLVSARIETMRQLFNGIDLDVSAGAKIGYPIQTAEVPIKKYMNFSLGLSYILFRDSMVPIAISVHGIKDNPSFANVPVFGGGLKTAELDTMWAGARITIGAWDRKLAFQLAYNNSISTSYKKENFGNDSFSATQIEANLLVDTNYFLKKSNMGLNLVSTKFSSSGTRELQGNNFSLAFHVGYAF